MLASVQECVELIENYLRRLDRPITNKLQSGVSSEVVKDAFNAAHLTAPSGLIALYSCHDGTKIKKGDSLDDAHYFPGFYWLSLSDAFNVYKAFFADTRWSKSWVPIFGNGGGDFFAVICEEGSPNFGSVVGFRVGQLEQPIQFENILSMMQFISRCYELGLYFLDNGYLEADDFKAAIVAKALNPNLSYYRD